MLAQTLPLSINIAQKPYIIGSLGPKALKYESFDGKGTCAPKPCRIVGCGLEEVLKEALNPKP